MVLDDLQAVLDEVGAAGPETFADAESIVILERQLDQLHSLVTGALAAFDASGRWSESGARSTSAWLQGTARRSVHEARTQMKRARALRHLPRTASAWAEGELTGAHVDVLASLATPATGAALARDEELLVGMARTLTHAEFVRAAEHWRLLADPDGSTEGAEERRNRRDAYLVQSVNGTWFGRMVFDPVSGSVVGNELHRLEELLFEAEWAEVKERLGREPTLSDLTRTPGQRRADAMEVMAIRSATMKKDGRKPRPLFTVLTQYETMLGTLSELENGTVVPPSSLLAWLVDADIERAEYRGDGTIAMGHRSTTATLRVKDFEAAVFGPPTRPECPETDRFFTRATRRAIEVRDRRCTHPGCDRQATWCQIDHIQPYSEGGLTTQQNGRVLCGPHNRMRVHRDQRPPPKRE